VKACAMVFETIDKLRIEVENANYLKKRIFKKLKPF